MPSDRSLTRRHFLAGAPAFASAKRRPNVLFVLTDDHGAWANHCYGCPDIQTPNLDKLAAGGARFTSAYACTPVCSPSRATYLTGRIPSTHGIQDWLYGDDVTGPTATEFLKGQTPFTQILADHGYTVGLTGKWHMGRDESAQAGFSYWSTVPGGGGTYRNATFVKNGAKRPTNGYKTDWVGNDAIEFIDQNRNGPFLLYCAFFAPHIPYDYQPDVYRAPYAGSRFECFPDEPIHPWHTRTMFGRTFGTLKDFHNPESKLSYSALVTGMDQNLGRIVNRLEELGIRDNTLIAFTADQGHCCGHHGIWGKGNSTVPFNMYEESLHVPLIWNHPGQIAAGGVLDPLISSYDFFPTILDYLDVKAPQDRRRPGHSYAGFLRGKPPRWRDELYFEYEYVRGIRTKNLKYIERTSEWPSELFDLEADPGERKNVIADRNRASELKALQGRLHGFFQHAGAPRLDQWRSTTKQQLPVYRR